MAPSCSMHIRHAVASRVVKGEDVIVACALDATQPQNMLFIVSDGHVGKQASKFVAANFQRVLCSKLPAKLLDSEASQSDVATFAEQIRRILCETFVELDNQLHTIARTSGTAVTALLILGPLLSVANIGDCHAVLDTGCFRLELTNSHRLVDNAAELNRLRTAGCLVAPLGFHFKGPAKPGEPGVGPLRMWPGGLCVSRTIGDFDSGPHVSPVPHIKQVLFTEETSSCRIILASDGLWDVLPFRKALSLARPQPIWSAAAELVRVASHNHKVIDDTSVVVIDICRTATEPAFNTGFDRQGLPRRAAIAPPPPPPGGGLFCCLRPAADEPEATADPSLSLGPGIPKLFADVDGLMAYPALKASLRRCQPQRPAGGGGGPGKAAMHDGLPPRPHTSTACFIMLEPVEEEQCKGGVPLQPRGAAESEGSVKTDSRSSGGLPAVVERRGSEVDLRLSAVSRPSPVLERHSSQSSSTRKAP